VILTQSSSARADDWPVFEKKPFTPAEGFIPDAETAREIAEILFRRFAPQSTLGVMKPFLVNQEGDVWKIRGKLPVGAIGGVPEIHMQKSDGKITHMTLYK